MEETLRDSTLKAVAHDDFSDWNDFVTEITERAAAEGIFLWACLTAPLAHKYLHDGHSPLEIRQRLREVPEELDAFYKHILQHVIDVSNRKRSLRLFQWVCLAFRPLSVTELRFALAAEDAMSSPCKLRCQDTNSFVDSDERMKKFIVSWSGGLMEVVPGSRRDMLSTLPDKRIYVDEVQVIHQSVNDFFTSKPVNEPFITCGLSILSSLAEAGQQWRHNEPKASNPGHSIYQSHAVLFRGCLNYFGSEELRIKSDKYGKPCIEPLPPFLEYAAPQIFHHASCSEEMYFFCHERHSFLKHMKEILPTWLEVCHLVRAWRHLHFDDKCYTLLNVASTLDLIELVTGLLEDGTSHEQQDQHGRRPLHYAARAGSIRVAQALLDVGAEIEVSCDKNETPLSLAAGVGEEDMVRLLLTHASQTNRTVGSLDAALLAAAEGGSIDHQPEGCLAVTRLLLTAGAKANAGGGQWANLLQTAAWGGDARQVRLLIENGANVNAQGGQFNTALIAASYMGEVEMVRLLIKNGANVNAQGGEYGTALQVASEGGHEGIVRLLIENRANVNAEVGEYGTALTLASGNGHEDVCSPTC
jgi:ankyrin repeat protein